MLGTTHIVIAATAGIGISSIIDIKINQIGWIPLLIGSIAPDIDKYNSKIANIGSLFYGVLPYSVRLIITLPLRILNFIVTILFCHRGPLHWPIVGIGLIYLGITKTSPTLTWFGIGYMTHIIADAITPAGISIFAPIYTGRIRCSLIKTGSLSEYLLMLCCIFYLVVYFVGVVSLPPIIRD